MTRFRNHLTVDDRNEQREWNFILFPEGSEKTIITRSGFKVLIKCKELDKDKLRSWSTEFPRWLGTTAAHWCDFSPNWKHTMLNTESMSIPSMRLGHARILEVFLWGIIGKEMILTSQNYMQRSLNHMAECHMRDSTGREFCHQHWLAA